MVSRLASLIRALGLCSQVATRSSGWLKAAAWLAPHFGFELFRSSGSFPAPCCTFLRAVAAAAPGSLAAATSKEASRLPAPATSGLGFAPRASAVALSLSPPLFAPTTVTDLRSGLSKCPSSAEF